MKLESFNICQNYAEKNNLNYEFVKSINDVLFKEIRNKIRTPNSLILKVGKLGDFFYKRTKVKTKVDFDKGKDDELLIHYHKVLTMYEEYMADRLKFKYEKFGKETHDAFLLDKEQKRVQRAKENKSK